MVSFADEVTVFKAKPKGKINDFVKYQTKTKEEESCLTPKIKGNNIEYDLGLLKVNNTYQTRVHLLHNFGNNIYFKDNIKHTTNFTIINISYKDNGHYLTIQIHPKKPLKMIDFLEITFAKKKKKKNMKEKQSKNENNNEETNDNNNNKKEESKEKEVNTNENENENVNANIEIKDKNIKMIFNANVLRKDQGTPLLSKGIKLLRGMQSIDTDVDTEWEGFK